MAHIVTCTVCGKKFDRDTIQAVKVGTRRYAHQECKPDGELVPLAVKKEVNSDLIKLKEYITKIYGDTANWALINRQLKKFQEENKYSLSGILKSLVYFYDIKGNPVDKSNGGIGIVPFTYQAAYNYYFSIFMAQQANENKVANNKVIEITIKPPKGRNYLKREFFNLEEWENNEE